MNRTIARTSPSWTGEDSPPMRVETGKHGEKSSPRFIVDRMVTSGHILPHRQYTTTTTAGPETLYENCWEQSVQPAGDRNFTATVLWHKTRYETLLTSTTKTAAPAAAGRKRAGENCHQLRRYQTYTIVARAKYVF